MLLMLMFQSQWSSISPPHWARRPRSRRRRRRRAPPSSDANPPVQPARSAGRIARSDSTTWLAILTSCSGRPQPSAIQVRWDHPHPLTSPLSVWWRCLTEPDTASKILMQMSARSYSQPGNIYTMEQFLPGSKPNCLTLTIIQTFLLFYIAPARACLETFRTALPCLGLHLLWQ